MGRPEPCEVVVDSHVGVDPEWDAFVERSPGGHHVQTSRWADVKAVVGWRAARVVLRRQGAPVAGFQILARGPPSLASVGYVPRGPVVSDGAGPDVLDSTLDALERVVRRDRVIYLKVQPPAGREDIGACLLRRGHSESALELAPTATVRVDVGRSDDQLLAGMRTNTRRNIRKAQRAGVTVRAGGDADLPTLYRFIEATGRRQDFPPYPARYYEQMWRSFAPGGKAHLLVAERDGIPLSAVLLIAFGDTVIYKMGGWSGDAREARPNELVHWTAIGWAREHGHRWYDLEGIDLPAARAVLAGETPPETAQRGVSHFKLGFGGEVTIFPPAYDSGGRGLLGIAAGRVGPRLERAAPLAARALGRGA